ncbi:restriction endonuclease subunit S [Lactococcus formosensis]|uniref:restriction endonuclease subunit S n=1 Tax=Lactococcus formosensis TaxID=1281486 RepID=UPI003267E492
MKMKDSGVEWIGEIPEDWDIGKVNRALKHVKEVAGDKHGLYPRLSLAKSGVIERPKYDGNGQAPADYNTYQIIPKQQFVFNLMGLEQDSDYRRVGVPEKSGLLSSGYVRMDNNSDVLNVKYGYYYFLTLESYRIFNAYGTGIRSTLNGKQLEKLPLILPAIDEQQKIADFLDSKIALIDQIIADTKRSIEELKAYKQSLITETVTKGLDPNVPMKDSGVEWIGEMPKEWQLSTYKYIAKIRNGKEITVDGGEVPVYGSGGIFKWTNEPLFIGESVLFGRKGSIGEPMIASGEFWTVDTMYYTEINKSRTSLKYCYYLSKSLPWDFYKTKTALPSIVGTQIESIKIPLPDKEEQDSITKFLDEKVKNIDNLIFGKQNLITDYESYKKSLIYEYVTGKKQVN